MRKSFRDASTTRPKLRQIVKRIPGFQNIYYKLKTDPSNDLLASHHQEFSPIYNILTVSEKNKHGRTICSE